MENNIEKKTTSDIDNNSFNIKSEKEENSAETIIFYPINFLCF